MEEEILFFKLKEPYGAFSNFARYPIIVCNQYWPTTEHFYQAQKTLDMELREKIRTAKTPREAANIGRSLKLRKDWEEKKNWYMTVAVLMKVLQHEEIRELLISTGNKIIKEHTDVEDYWSDGGDGSGKNMLGRILMRVRDLITEGEND